MKIKKEMIDFIDFRGCQSPGMSGGSNENLREEEKKVGCVSNIKWPEFFSYQINY